VINNTITGNRNEGILAWGPVTVNLLRNNIITSNGYCGVGAGPDAAYQTIDHNNVWMNNYDGEGNYCDYYGNASIPPTPGEGAISEDPLFVDAANGDYDLSADSPCINSGTSESAPEYDIAGTLRDAFPDMGAYEWGKFRIFLPFTLSDTGQ